MQGLGLSVELLNQQPSSRIASAQTLDDVADQRARWHDYTATLSKPELFGSGQTKMDEATSPTLDSGQAMEKETDITNKGQSLDATSQTSGTIPADEMHDDDKRS